MYVIPLLCIRVGRTVRMVDHWLCYKSYSILPFSWYIYIYIIIYHFGFESAETIKYRIEKQKYEIKIKAAHAVKIGSNDLIGQISEIYYCCCVRKTILNDAISCLS